MLLLHTCKISCDLRLCVHYCFCLFTTFQDFLLIEQTILLCKLTYIKNKKRKCSFYYYFIHHFILRIRVLVLQLVWQAYVARVSSLIWHCNTSRQGIGIVIEVSLIKRSNPMSPNLNQTETNLYWLNAFLESSTTWFIVTGNTGWVEYFNLILKYLRNTYSFEEEYHSFINT